jgi:hypothetical protein
MNISVILVRSAATYYIFCIIYNRVGSGVSDIFPILNYVTLYNHIWSYVIFTGRQSRGMKTCEARFGRGLRLLL